MYERAGGYISISHLSNAGGRQGVISPYHTLVMLVEGGGVISPYHTLVCR